MIGMINIPNDSPAEFYAAPRRFFSELGPSPSTEIDIDNLSLNSKISNNNNNNKSSVHRPSSISVFGRKKPSQNIGYLSDGRKVFDGKVVNPSSVPKLWEQLIVRTFVHKMEDEISSPADQFVKLQESLPKLTRQNSASTYSLVSQNRLESQCEKCSPKKFFGNIRQIAFLSKSSTKLHNHNHHDSSSSISSSHSSSSNSDETKKGNQYLSPSKKIIRRRSRNSVVSQF
uniref:Uncharacterized protein n=1 Tax=Panagrolaimus sp. ES5 TaxID=591445 RepID=A0AC34F6K8_9BILA